MPPLLAPLLAQQQPEPTSADRGALTVWDAFNEWAMREYGVSPVTSALVFLGILLVLTIIVERVSIALLRKRC